MKRQTASLGNLQGYSWLASKMENFLPPKLVHFFPSASSLQVDNRSHPLKLKSPNFKNSKYSMLQGSRRFIYKLLYIYMYNYSNISGFFFKIFHKARAAQVAELRRQAEAEQAMIRVVQEGTCCTSKSWFSRWFQIYVLFSPRKLGKISNLTIFFRQMG